MAFINICASGVSRKLTGAFVATAVAAFLFTDQVRRRRAGAGRGNTSDIATDSTLESASFIPVVDTEVSTFSPDSEDILSTRFGPTSKERLAAGDTDVGLQRENNEDDFLCQPERGLYAVLDGMGGMAAGEVASKIARDSLNAFFTAEKIDGLKSATDDEIESTLRLSLESANAGIHHYVRANPFNKGMGAAAVIALVLGDRLHTASLGDCRAYVVGVSGQAEQVTYDQTLASFLIENKELTIEQARHHQSRHTLLAYLGDSDELKTIVAPPRQLVAGERIVLCSDGLWEIVDERVIAATVCQFPFPKDAVKELISLANDPCGDEPGGVDNITVVVVGPEEEIQIA